MRRNYSRQIVSLLLLSLIIVFVSCRKDNMIDSGTSYLCQESDMNSQAEAIVKRIKDFESSLDYVKRGESRGDTYIDADSAMWNIEALFNSTFSMPDENYVEKKMQELTFDIDIRRDNKLSMREVNRLYEDVIKSVKDAYINDGIEEDKGLMSIVIDKGGSALRTSKVKVTVITGRTNTVKTPEYEMYHGGPFDIDGCWYYGEFGGTCDDPFLLTDAAELLESALNNYCGVSASTDGNINIYVDLTMISLKGNEYKNANGDSYLFYKVNCEQDELYLKGKDLNRYYYWEKQIIFNNVLEDSQFASVLPEDPVFIEINIDGLSQMNGVNTIYYHHHDILYGTRCEIPRNILGNSRNILNY